VHVHTIAAVVAGRRWPAGVELADREMLKGIGLPAAGEMALLPVMANSQDMTELGRQLERVWNPRVPGVLVADHGLCAWGASLLNARHHTEIIEWILEFMTSQNCDDARNRGQQPECWPGDPARRDMGSIGAALPSGTGDRTGTPNKVDTLVSLGTAEGDRTPVVADKLTIKMRIIY
jgi:hypothetical protein